MSDPFLAEVSMVGFNFAPRAWAFTNGQIMSLAQNTALFSLLGTTYGGDGRSTFALPNLQGSVPVHSDQFGGGQQYPLGSTGGSTSAVLRSISTAANPPAPITAIALQPATISTASPYLVLNFIIALQGIYPARP